MILNFSSQKTKSPSPYAHGHHPVGRGALLCTCAGVSIIQSDGQDSSKPYPYEKVSHRLAHVVLGGQVKTLPGSGHGTGSTSTDKKGLEPVSSLSPSVRVMAESGHSGQLILRGRDREEDSSYTSFFCPKGDTTN